MMESSTATAAGPAAAGAGADGERGWLTAVLRPAGALDADAVRGLASALSQLAAVSNMVMVDLTAARVPDPRAFARAVREPAAAFERAGRCLVLTGAAAALTAELDRAAVPVVTLAADVLPSQSTAG
jgi:hypothetical protein